MARQKARNRDFKKPGSVNNKNRKEPVSENWNQKICLFIAFNIVVVILSVVYIFCQHMAENIVVTPLNVPKVVVDSSNDKYYRYWGTYLPGSYFAMRTRNPQTVTAGLMWFTQNPQQFYKDINIRHWCEQWNGVNHFTWVNHDGENFGVQHIDDKDVLIDTSFIKQGGKPYGGDFAAKLSFKPKVDLNNKQVPVSMLFYIHVPSQGLLSPRVVDGGHLKSISGYLESLKNFTVRFEEMKGSKNVLMYSYLLAEAPNIAHLKEVVYKHLALFPSKKSDIQFLGLIGNASAFALKTDKKYEANIVVYQATFIPPFELEVYFKSLNSIEYRKAITGEDFDPILADHLSTFIKKFDQVFQLESKGFSVLEIESARAAFSNMMGGIGYFHGSSLVQSSYNKEPVNYWDASLYTAVPSRSFFPRGFLWDEGFHNLFIMQWNAEISKEILGHWLDLMNIEGWIPREQILGPDARERVPAEFVVQKNTNANPPTLFLTMDMLLSKMKAGGIPKDIDFFKRALPRLKVWFEWFNKTQNGMLPGTYRWRGRDSNANVELNPKTLTSGLDDYPRATHPTIDERHLDLRCWIALAAGVLSDIGEFVGDNVEKYRETHAYLTNNELLDSLHWSKESQSYSDYGFHSTKVELIKKQLPVVPGQHHQSQVVTIRVVNEEPNLRFIDNFGYVSLFPFLLKIIDPQNPKLAKVLTDLKNPKLLWTKFGLRSLASNSPYYMKPNTEHDPPYWRGAIWINMNYLAVRALEYYSTTDGPYQDRSRKLYKELRNNVVTNVINEYKRTGFIWEQYDDRTGHGKGAHPFTGWSALFVLMMAEIY